MKHGSDQLKEHYERMPYESHAFQQSSPENIAAVAALFGVQCASPETARVLEIGCSSGGNLIPYAARNPKAKALGIELSPRQVATGVAMIGRLGLNNIDILAADISTIAPSELGTFDYVVCHGVYSWVPEEVQNSILRLCGAVLSETGVAYISYNTYPGWKAKEIIRDAMLLHGAGKEDVSAQVSHAKAMVGFLHAVTTSKSLEAILGENSDIIQKSGDYYIAHDYLEPCNNPSYFGAFVESARQNQLQYLAEAQPSMMLPENYGEKVAQTLYQAFGNDPIRREQYLDFAINRSFRQTLLTRAGAPKWNSPGLDRNAVRTLNFSARIPCLSGKTRLDGSFQTYGEKGTNEIATQNNAVKLAAEFLTSSWPDTCSHAEIVSSIEGSLDDVSAASSAIEELLEHLVAKGVARTTTTPIKSKRQAQENPIIKPMIRAQISMLAKDEFIVPNLWHESIELQPHEKVIYPMLDGCSPPSDITLRLQHDFLLEDGSTPSPEKCQELLESAIDRLPALSIC